ncbi:uncharacterized protein LOC132921392 [Rhopalosiphum padi]|nr:uncharacterized protein LOC132921392 [Rhopalosiphum padi]
MDRFLSTTSNKRVCLEKVDDPPAVDVSAPLSEFKFQYLFDTFYKLVSINGDKIKASCQNCHKVITAYKTSSGNLLSHIKSQHTFLVSKVEDARKRKNESTQSTSSTFIQSKIYDSTKKVSKDKINELVFNYIVNEMRPLITCEKRSFRELIMGLTGIKDTSILPNRIQIKAQLTSRYGLYVQMLTDLIQQHNYICATADIWSSNNKSFMGMTCHMINESTYERTSYILGCRRMMGSHNYINIAEMMTDITETYKLDHSKITHTVTDNASNFCKSFKTFSKPLPDVHQINSCTFGNFNEDSDAGNCSTDTADDEDTNLNLVDVYEVLSTPVISDTANDNFSLPSHITCCAHTLNLIATRDISSIDDSKYKKMSELSFQKLQSFWNLLSRSTVASDKVFEICGCKFPVPIMTRWNSLFDATKKVLLHKTEVIKAFEELRLTKLKANEWDFLKEYCNVMEPLTISLDKMQCEKKGFLGYVAPIILVLRRTLILLSNLKYCRPLCIKIVQS